MGWIVISPKDAGVLISRTWECDPSRVFVGQVKRGHWGSNSSSMTVPLYKGEFGHEDRHTQKEDKK